MGFSLGCDVFFIGSGGWGGANCLNEFGMLRVEEGLVEMVPIRFWSDFTTPWRLNTQLDKRLVPKTIQCSKCQICLSCLTSSLHYLGNISKFQVVFYPNYSKLRTAPKGYFFQWWISRDSMAEMNSKTGGVHKEAVAELTVKECHCFGRKPFLSLKIGGNPWSDNFGNSLGWSKY